MLAFKDMTIAEIINHFDRSGDSNMRDLAEVFRKQERRIFEAKNALEQLRIEHDQEYCGCDQICESGEDCEDHHCSTCTCFK